MFLRSFLAKISLSVLTVPIAIFTNAVRIGTLWFLATWVDPGFLFGSLHNKGGILFSLISLSILASFLCILRKMDAVGHQGRTVGEGKIDFATSVRGQAPTLL